ncbi:hypothetical protein J5N97_010226 [Dioscorea zingiberensis]|uniref:histone deacetylase n=1 Tax=Dioscorea zingiberensis TaxID=325984 RepID=A0A9D5CYR2_9LILI|nr:hypothetical protein J5N97_010226 [Dioscorea zingiberensis]
MEERRQSRPPAGSKPSPATMASQEDLRSRRPPVGLVYDDRMCRHSTPDGELHPECPDRIRSIWTKLKFEGIPQRCVVLNGKEAEDEHLASVHTKRHIKLIKGISNKEFDSRRDRVASKFNSIYLNKGSSEAAYLAAGSVVEVCKSVVEGQLRSGFAIVRPPGHHAEANEAMGFCLFNNIAVAANFLLDKHQLGIKKILIVDWDVHHGNGTQKMFYKDPRVLFFSVHRYDSGTFYPAGDDGAYFMIGEGPGAGYNINVPWEHGQCGDADYNAIWDHVLLPIAKAYNPDIILISAGFDAAIGDPLGGCCITPYGYSLLLMKLMDFAQGKIVMALEGGYNLTSLANSVFACVRTLLEEKTINGSLRGHPFKSTWRVIQQVRQRLKSFWPFLAAEIPQELLACTRKETQTQLIYNSTSDSNVEKEEQTPSQVCSANMVEGVGDVVQPFSNSSVDKDKHGEAKTTEHKTNDQDSFEGYPVPEASDSKKFSMAEYIRSIGLEDYFMEAVKRHVHGKINKKLIERGSNPIEWNDFLKHLKEEKRPPIEAISQESRMTQIANFIKSDKNVSDFFFKSVRQHVYQKINGKRKKKGNDPISWAKFNEIADDALSKNIADDAADN